MGTLVYDQTTLAELDDRVLAHLQVVIINKLRRLESFSLTLTGANNTTRCVWVSPRTPLTFIYAGNRQPSLNRLWIEQLAETANQASGLRVIPEPPFTDPMAGELAE